MSRKWSVGILTVSAVLVASTSHAVDLAKVNGKVITEKELQSAVSSLNEGMRQNVLKDVNTKRQLLTSVIEQELLVDEGEKQKIDQSAEFKEAVATFRKSFIANQVLQKSLASKLTDKEAKKYYEAHKDRYGTDQVHAQHILLSEEAQAQDMIKKARAENTDFQDLAEKFSRDPSAKSNRGDLGFFGRDRMVTEFTDAAFRGKVGEVVGPVKTAYGYHVIKVLAKQPGKPMEYDEVELRVKNDLRAELTQNYLGRLRTQAKIEVNQPALDKL